MNTNPAFLDQQPAVSPRSQRSREKQRARDTSLEPLLEDLPAAEGADDFISSRSTSLRPPMPDNSNLPYLRPPQQPAPLLSSTRPLDLGSRVGHVPKIPGDDIPILPPGQRRPTPFTVDFGALARQQHEEERNWRTPKQNPTDPSRYQLPPLRERPISAPLQPRITDLRAHIERDPTRANPHFTVQVSFDFSMQPGDLP